MAEHTKLLTLQTCIKIWSNFKLALPYLWVYHFLCVSIVNMYFTRTVPSSTASGLIHPRIEICFDAGEAIFDEGKIWMNDKSFNSLVNNGLPSNPAGVYNGSYAIQDSLLGILLVVTSTGPKALLKGQRPTGAGSKGWYICDKLCSEKWKHKLKRQKVWKKIFSFYKLTWVLTTSTWLGVRYTAYST